MTKNIKCILCNNEFSTKNKIPKFCSRKCYYTHRNENKPLYYSKPRKKKPLSEKKYTKVVCEYCRKSFMKKDTTVNVSKNMFCSVKCKTNFQYNTNHIFIKCKCCSNWSEKRKSYLDNHPEYFCDKKCYDIGTKEKRSIEFTKLLINNNPMNNKEYRDKISTALKGKNVGFGTCGKKSKHTTQSKNKMREVRLQSMSDGNNKCFRNNKLEVSFYNNFLINESFVKQKRINIYCVDFYNEDKKIVIELFGDYWHCNPEFWGPKKINTSKNLLAEEVWNYDGKKISYLKSLGYEVYVFWEYDIKNNIEDVRKKIKQILT